MFILNPECPLGKRELDALGKLGPILGDMYNISGEVGNFVGECIASACGYVPTEVRKAFQATTNLLTRMNNDAVIIADAALRGYHLQAGTIASSMYESHYDVLYICDDLNRAEEWFAHADEVRRYKAPKKMALDIYTRIGFPNPKEKMEKEAAHYRYLCQIKHVNPIIQKDFGVTFCEHQTIIRNGPDTSFEAMVISLDSLLHACRYRLIAVYGFVKTFQPDERRDDLIKARSQLYQHMDDCFKKTESTIEALVTDWLESIKAGKGAVPESETS